MKVAAVPQLLLLTVAAVSAAPPLKANYERHVCSHGVAQAHPVELKQSNLKETQLMLDFDDRLEHDLNEEEKSEGDQKRCHHGLSGDYPQPVPTGGNVGQQFHFQDHSHHDTNQNIENRPNHTPCRMRHTDQSFNPRGVHDLSDLEHGSLLHKRAVEVSSTTTSPHLDVLNPVDKVYGAPVPELKGGVRRRSAAGETTTTEKPRIKWVPPPEVMPVLDDTEEGESTHITEGHKTPKVRSVPDTHPEKVEDKSTSASPDTLKALESASKPDDKGTPKKRNAVVLEHSPHGHVKDLEQIEKDKQSEQLGQSSQDQQVSTSSKVSSDEAAPATSVPNKAQSKRSLEHVDAHTVIKEDTPESSTSGTAESTTSEPKKLSARRRRSVENTESSQGHQSSTPSKVSSDEAAPATSVTNKAQSKRSAEHGDTHAAIKEDTPESSISSTTESTKSEPKKSGARRRRSVENKESSQDQHDSTPSAAVPATSVPIKAHAKRSAEHGGAHEIKEDTPESSTAGPAESTSSEPKKSSSRRRRSVETKESSQDQHVSSPSKASSDETASATSVPNKAHAKRSAEHGGVHEIKEDTPESSTAGAAESTSSKSTKSTSRRRRSVETKESSQDQHVSSPSKSSSDETASATSVPNKAHSKRSAEHGGVHEIQADTPEASTAESTTAEPKKSSSRRRRSLETKELSQDQHVSTPTKVSSDETAPTTSVPNKAQSKRSAEHKDTHTAIKEDTPESSTCDTTGSKTSEKKASSRRRRSIENEELSQGQQSTTTNKASSDEAAPATSVPNKTHSKRSAEHGDAHTIKEDSPESSTSGAIESATSEPKNKAQSKRSAEHGDAQAAIKDDTPESSTFGVTESGIFKPNKANARRRRSVENKELLKDEQSSTDSKVSSDETASATSVPNKAHSKRSSEHGGAHEIKADTPEAYTAESTTAEPKKSNSRRKRSVETKESSQDQHVSTPSKTSSDETASATLVPHKAQSKRSAEHEGGHEIKKDTPESTSGLTESTTSEPKKENARRRRSIESKESSQAQLVSTPSSDETASATSLPHKAQSKRSAEHGGVHTEIKEDVLKSTTTETTRKERSMHDGGKEGDEECSGQKSYRIDAPGAPPMSDGENERDLRSAKDVEHGNAEDKGEKRTTEEPILKREIRRRRQEVEKSEPIKSKEETTHEEIRVFHTTPEPAEKKVKRVVRSAELNTPAQVPSDGLLYEKTPAEGQKSSPRSRIEALIMGGEETCCKGKHASGMHGNNLK